MLASPLRQRSQLAPTLPLVRPRPGEQTSQGGHVGVDACPLFLLLLTAVVVVGAEQLRKEGMCRGRGGADGMSFIYRVSPRRCLQRAVRYVRSSVRRELSCSILFLLEREGQRWCWKPRQPHVLKGVWVQTIAEGKRFVILNVMSCQGAQGEIYPSRTRSGVGFIS